MAVQTKAQLKAYKDANRTSNGVNANTGATENKMWEDIIDSFYSKLDDSIWVGLYSATNTYGVGQIVAYDYGSGIALYICNTAATTGAWDSSKWNRESPIKGNETLVASVVKSITFEHDLGAAGTAWVFSGTPYCYDAGGNIVGFKITNRTKSGFDVEAIANSTFEYSTLLKEV